MLVEIFYPWRNKQESSACLRNCLECFANRNLMPNLVLQQIMSGDEYRQAFRNWYSIFARFKWFRWRTSYQTFTFRLWDGFSHIPEDKINRNSYFRPRFTNQDQWQMKKFLRKIKWSKNLYDSCSCVCLI